MKKIELSIIAPMFNEELNVETTLLSLNETMQSFNEPWEVIFVNDGSTDNTINIARKLEKVNDNLRVISYNYNRGRGYALRTGFENAEGKYFVTIDFDLSYHPKHILNIYNELKNNDSLDVVLGSAYMPGGKTVGVSFGRLFISKASNKFFKFFSPQKISTSTCVLRGYQKEAIKSLELKSDDKEIHLEIISKLLATGYRIGEIPATLESRKVGSSKFSFSSFLMSHLNYSLFERPAKLFGLFGLIFTLSGISLATYLLYQFFAGISNPDRPLATVSLVLLLAGLQLLIFTIITFQIVNLRTELVLIQKQNRKISNKSGKKNRE